MKRKSVPIEDIRLIQRVCFDMDDEIRWLVALLSDPGMRLSEAAGSITSDIHLNSKVPHIRLKPHSWRPLKHLVVSGMFVWLVLRFGLLNVLLKMLREVFYFPDIVPPLSAKLILPVTHSISSYANIYRKGLLYIRFVI